MSTPAPKLPGDDKVEPIVIAVAVIILILYPILLAYDAAHPIH